MRYGKVCKDGIGIMKVCILL